VTNSRCRAHFTTAFCRVLAAGRLKNRVRSIVRRETASCQVVGSAWLQGNTPAADWSEFGAKVRLLFDELTIDLTEGWLDAIRESVSADIERLEA
jgi:hypothetical protein